jgi:hypothetical protein
VPSPRVASNSIIEFGGGKGSRPTYTSNALAPTPGQQTTAPDPTIRIIGVDFQTVTVTAGFAAGSAGVITFPTVGFPGLQSAAPSYYNGAVPPTSTLPTNIASLGIGQSTQLMLSCHVQLVTSSIPTLVIGQVSLPTSAFDNLTNLTYIGPLFGSGTTYIAFSCTPSMVVFNPGAAAPGVVFTLGIQAILYGMFVH